MKIRVYMAMDDSVYCVRIDTEDWSLGDVELMEQFGEPDVNVGGEVAYSYGDESKTKTFGDEFVRLIHGFPYVRGFDSRDYGSVGESVAVGVAWKEAVLQKITNSVLALRTHSSPLPTEEVTEV